MLEQMRNIQACEYKQRAAHALNCDRLTEEHDAEHRRKHRASDRQQPVLEKRGITPNLSFSTPDSFVACGMVKAGLGVALVNRVIADELSDAVAYVPLDPPEVIDICAVTPTADVISPAAKIFKSYALEFLEDF